jgi:DNA-binding XRE family transcriptional regulator
MNFFEEQRGKLDLNRTQIAARVGATAETVRLWEIERNVPSTPIATLAAGYEVTEQRMEREVMALRRRIEAREAAAAPEEEARRLTVTPILPPGREAPFVPGRAL